MTSATSHHHVVLHIGYWKSVAWINGAPTASRPRPTPPCIRALLSGHTKISSDMEAAMLLLLQDIMIGDLMISTWDLHCTFVQSSAFPDLLKRLLISVTNVLITAFNGKATIDFADSLVCITSSSGLRSAVVLNVDYLAVEAEVVVETLAISHGHIQPGLVLSHIALTLSILRSIIVSHASHAVSLNTKITAPVASKPVVHGTVAGFVDHFLRVKSQRTLIGDVIRWAEVLLLSDSKKDTGTNLIIPALIREQIWGDTRGSEVTVSIPTEVLASARRCVLEPGALLEHAKWLTEGVAVPTGELCEMYDMLLHGYALCSDLPDAGTLQQLALAAAPLDYVKRLTNAYVVANTTNLKIQWLDDELRAVIAKQDGIVCDLTHSRLAALFS